MPDIAYETADPLTSLGLVGAGLGLATVQESLRSAAPRGSSSAICPGSSAACRSTSSGVGRIGGR
ncbi:MULTISPECIES: hypothetical protein [unclassified Mesorhizobium]|uniref:hypothetical protein n=1 Tax=unclassified Mesorhizobium TaxID=325217 RepID=UPI001FE11E81|nr:MULTISPECIES: hypothetical protein [unclassified Mesorhizobium]